MKILHHAFLTCDYCGYMVEDDYLFSDYPEVGMICEVLDCRCSGKFPRNGDPLVPWKVVSVEEFKEDTITDQQEIEGFQLTHSKLDFVPDKIRLFEFIVKRSN